VDTAIKAEAAQARVRHPEIARFPDDYDEDEIVAVRLGMRAALETVLPMILAEVIEECAREAGELQPIETAPKDGTAILACGAWTMPDGSYWVGWIADGCFDGEHWRFGSLDLDPEEYSPPTHWMPIPAPRPEPLSRPASRKRSSRSQATSRR
jgi:hypothetical protein